MHHAAQWDTTAKAIPLLIAAGANPDQQTNFGETPLHNAALMSVFNPKGLAIALLIDANADITIKEKSYYTAQDLIIDDKIRDIFDQAIQKRREKIDYLVLVDELTDCYLN